MGYRSHENVCNDVWHEGTQLDTGPRQTAMLDVKEDAIYMFRMQNFWQALGTVPSLLHVLPCKQVITALPLYALV